MASNPPVQQLPIALRLPGVRTIGGLRLPLVLLVGLFYLILLPEQANLNLGGVLLPPYRLFLIAYLPFFLFHAFRSTFRFAWPDLLILAACGWIWLASYMTGSLSEAVLQGGAHSIDIGMVYFAARFGIQTARDFRLFLILAAPGVAVMGGVVLLESITGRFIIQPLMADITGVPSRLAVEYRLGLMRGAASYPHPILAGICLASFLPLYFMAGIRGWPKLVGWLGAIGGFFSFSSAAFLGLIVAPVLVLYDWFVVRIANLSWRIFLAGASFLFVMVEMLSNSGFFNLMVRYASLNTVSAFNRVLIWRFGSRSVAENPWFGIGYDDWDRPAWMHWDTAFSVDNFWLLIAMRFGIPVAGLLVLLTVTAVGVLGWRSTRHQAADARLMRGLAISLGVFALGIISVALWLIALAWFFVLVGIAVSLAFQPETRPIPRMAIARLTAP